MAAFEIETGCGEKLRIGVRKYRGVEILSVRKWYLNAHEKKWFPTQHGLNLSCKRWREILPELVRLLEPPGEAVDATIKVKATVLTRNKQGKSPKGA